MNRFIAWFIAICTLALPADARMPRSDQILPLTSQTMSDARELAADAEAAGVFLAKYRIQSHAGWGDGPPIGFFSTPFSRVVQAAIAARKRGATFAVEDMSPMLLEPQIHVVALSQPALVIGDDKAVASVLSVTLAIRGSRNPTDVIKPVKTLALGEDYENLFGIKAERGGVLAVFPLASMIPGMEIRVEFDRIARAPSPSSMCRQCAVPLNVVRIR
jgi:hypothetical protein